jgi:transcriptional regulator with XRE-family HTH domain
MDLGARIKGWRDAKGWTRQDLAAKVSVSVAAVYQWEGTGKTKTVPRPKMLETIAAAFGVTIPAFYGPIPPAKSTKKKKAA